MRVSLSEYLLAARTGAWLLTLPVRLRFRTLPRFLAGIRPRSPTRLRDDRETDRTARVVTRVCRFPIFDLPIFPRICLRRSLALYHVLGRMGHPVSIHIGVRKDDRDFEGHSWVTLDGKSLGERDPVESFRAIYSYPIEGLSSG